MGCLVTDPVDFPEELQCPPSIETRPTCSTDSTPPCFPLNEVVRVDLDEATEDLVFEADIRDCNESERLQTLALLDFRPDFGTPIGPAQVPDGTRLVEPAEREAFQFRLMFDRLMAAGGGKCHKLELRVSTGFESLTSPLPAMPGDLGTATWWIAVTDGLNESVEMTECP